MGRNEKIGTECAKELTEFVKEHLEKGDMSTDTLYKICNKQSLEMSTFFLARIADALEELNENIKNLAADRNTNPAHADDGK